MVGALTGVRSDVIPFGLASGHYAALAGLNTVGMKRRKFTRERLAAVRSFYQKLFHGPARARARRVFLSCASAHMGSLQRHRPGKRAVRAVGPHLIISERQQRTTTAEAQAGPIASNR
jgi:hypothetical protein